MTLHRLRLNSVFSFYKPSLFCLSEHLLISFGTPILSRLIGTEYRNIPITDYVPACEVLPAYAVTTSENALTAFGAFLRRCG